MAYQSKWYHMTATNPYKSDAKGLEYMRLVDEYYAEKDGIMADVLELADEYDCLAIIDTDAPTNHPRWWFLHRSLRIDGWQLTSVDELGPIGHDDIGHDPHELSHSLPDNFDCYYIR